MKINTYLLILLSALFVISFFPYTADSVDGLNLDISEKIRWIIFQYLIMMGLLNLTLTI